MIEPNTFLNCDCMELMKQIPDKFFELAIVIHRMAAAVPTQTQFSRGGY